MAIIDVSNDDDTTYLYDDDITLLVKDSKVDITADVTTSGKTSPAVDTLKICLNRKRLATEESQEVCTLRSYTF